MKYKASTLKNSIFFIIILLLIIPQTRLPIQVFLNKGLALLSPGLEKNKRDLTNYNWQLKRNDNRPYNLSETKGKVVLINFWATWCPPCIAEMPSLHDLYDDYKDKIEFVLVSSEEKTTIASFLDKKGYHFNFYTPTEIPPETFKVSSIPRTFLISKTGKIIIDETGAANWNSKKVRETIDQLLKE